MTPDDSQARRLAELEAENAQLRHQLSECRKDWMYHSDCRPNRKQAEAAMADAKAINDKWADEVKARREAEQRAEPAEQAVQALREALECALPYVEAHCGAKGLTAGMAEAQVNRIKTVLASSGARVSTEHENADGSLGSTGRGNS